MGTFHFSHPTNSNTKRVIPLRNKLHFFENILFAHRCIVWCTKKVIKPTVLSSQTGCQNTLRLESFAKDKVLKQNLELPLNATEQDTFAPVLLRERVLKDSLLLYSRVLVWGYLQVENFRQQNENFYFEF